MTLQSHQRSQLKGVNIKNIQNIRKFLPLREHNIIQSIVKNTESEGERLLHACRLRGVYMFISAG